MMPYLASAHCRAGGVSGLPSLDFELHSVEGSLEEMDVAVVGGDDEIAVDPCGVFVSADEERQRKPFEHVVVEDLELVVGK